MTSHLLELCNMKRTQIKDSVDSFTTIGKNNKPRGCFSISKSSTITV